MSLYCNCQTKPNPRKIDMCLNTGLLGVIKLAGYKPVASCCGHGRYPVTIIIRHNTDTTRTSEMYWEFFSGKHIPRKARFYVKDKEGRFFLPEVVR